VQSVPFFGGLVLVFGCALLIAAVHQVADEPRKPATLVAVLATAVFTALISFNYVCQTTFVPALVRAYRPEYDPLISTFSLANPLSLAWAVEMWGYAFLGIATWFAASVFDGDGLEKVTRALMMLNGVLSVLGALVTAVDLGWVLSSAGMISYLGWNIVMLTLAVLLLLVFQRRRRATQSPRLVLGQDLFL
jgi:hypothetical protein